jgi:dihydrofolate reductase
MIRAIMAAVADNSVIGKDNDLAWHLPADLRHFKKTTSGHYIVMGRKTFESLGKPLPNRTSIIITRNPDYRQEGAVVVYSLEAALGLAEKNGQEKVFILGGGEIYRQAMSVADHMYITEVHGSFEGDTFFPEIDKSVWKEVHREDYPADEKNKYPYSFVEYIKRVKG